MTAHGLDVDEDGDGVVDQRASLPADPPTRTDRRPAFEIELLEPGASAFCFTFG